MSIPMFLSVGKTTVSVKRFGSGSYVNSRWQEGSETTFTIVANVQPHLVKRFTVNGAVGDFTKKAIKLYTTTTLNMAQEGSTLKKGDQVSWESEWYEVQETYTYVMGVLNHTKAVCIRLERV